MPKVVDPQERRELIADAVFALIERGGIEEASLRNVASQAGLNVGSVRHYVDGHEGMLIDAVQVMSERIEARIRARIAGFEAIVGSAEVTFADFREMSVDLLQEFLPLDERRRREVVVWLAFCERSRVQESLCAEARALVDGPRLVARPLLTWVGVDELDVRAEWLASAVDGLAIGLLHDPDRLTPVQVRELLRRHFTAVTTDAAGATGAGVSSR